jgi:hypothetical protein
MVRPGADHHRAFLLRVWTREQSGALLSSIRDVETGETHVFANLDQLNEWLGREMNRRRASRSRSTGSPGRRRGNRTRRSPGGAQG